MGGIGGTGTTEVEPGATLELKDETAQSVTNDMIIGGTVDPKVSVFAEGVNVKVEDQGLLILQPGTLYATIAQETGSTMTVKAAD